MSLTPAHRYCPACGSPHLAWRIPDGDDRERQVCADCGTIHYHNPRNVAGCICEHEGRILFCRRAIEPRSGYWTVPAGFMENGESLAAAAARETIEEAGIVAHSLALHAIFNLPNINQVYVLFRADVEDENVASGPESLETTWFTEAEVPWDTLAFPVIHEGLQRYFADRRAGRFGVHMGDILRDGQGTLQVRDHAGDEHPATPDWRRR